MKRIFLIFLLLVLNVSLFGQVYYIEFDFSSGCGGYDAIECLAQLDYSMELEWLWSDGHTTYDELNSLKAKTGFYEFTVEKLRVYYRSGGYDTISIGNCMQIMDPKCDRMSVPIEYSVSQNQVLPTVNLRAQDGNYYCAKENLKFYLISMKDELCKSKFEFYFIQNGEIKYTKTCSQSYLDISYSELCNKLNPLESFYVLVNFETNGGQNFTVKNLIYPIYPYVEVDESKLEIVDDNLYYPDLQENQKISLTNINKAWTFEITSDRQKPYFLEKLYGIFNITIAQDKRCSLTKSFIYPELKYNYVNDTKDKKDKFHFWYSGEERKVANLSLYNKSERDFLNVNLDYISLSPLMELDSINEKGKILCKTNADKPDTLRVDEYIYSLSSTDTLTQIKITSSDKDFIPVTRTVSLKSYPQISEPQVAIENATCYYNSAVVEVSGMKGGLQNGYKFMLKKGEKEFWSEDSIIKIPATAFGGNEQEAMLYVLDKDSITEDTGREKRAFSTDVKFNYGETLNILEKKVTDLLCFEDNTGKISITDWTPKRDDIRFEVWKSENKISDSQITENLSAGNYNLKIIDRKNCVNDSFQVVVNQPEKPLEISLDTVNNPVCFGYSNGRIVTHATGGTKGDSYKFSWNTGCQDSIIQEVPSGIYTLTVTDQNNCQTSVNQKLIDPEELQNSLTPSFTICKNGELKIDEGELKTKEDLTYSWLLPNGNIHEDRVLVVTSDMPEGDYIMYTSDSKGCFTKDTTNIKFADNELKIKFLAPTYSYLGDTVVLAEDSEIFTDYTWSYQFNNDMFEDITSSMYNTPKNQTFLLSLTSGSDTITMYANDGKCNASYSKVVNILNEQRSDYSNYEAPSAGIFTRLAIGPSPNDGNFTLYANLTEEAALDVFILDLQTALKIPLKYDFKFVSDHYAMPVHGLNLLKGVYALFVTANGDTKYVKFTVK